MSDVILMEAVTETDSTKYVKKYKCPYCEKRFERQRLHIHIQNDDEDLIPEGYTALRVAFNTINNKTEGHCIMCGRITDWNEDKGRYERLCNDPACHEKYKQMCAERNRKIYGTDRLQNDPKYAEEVQRKALAGRKIAGKYKFADGGEVQFLGTYEKKLLEFMDKVMRCKSEDIVAPGPAVNYTLDGVKRVYLPDFYYIPYNLLIEIKDGGENPNGHPHKEEDMRRTLAKEEAIKKARKYSYVRVTDNNFGQLLQIMSVLKFRIYEGKVWPIMRINESSMMEDMSGTIAAALPLTPTPIPYESDKSNYYVVQHLKNNVYNYGITKDPLQYQILGVDPEDENFYKVYKTDKSKINKKYLTFKIKDSESARELYEELALQYRSNKKVFTNETSFDYIYQKLTNGSRIIDENQLFYDDRFELVNDWETQLNEDCEKLYNYLKARPIDLLEEQVMALNEDQYTDNLALYNVMPDNIDNVEDLLFWKYRFDAMTYHDRRFSDDLSTDLYGDSNINRYKNKYSILIDKEDPNSQPPEDAENTYEGIHRINYGINGLMEASAEEKVIVKDDWEALIDKVRVAEADGLIIMIDPEAGFYDNYTEESIAKIKNKWELLQGLPENKRVLSNQTASSIFGIDNNALYEKILNAYLTRLDREIRDKEASCINQAPEIELPSNNLDSMRQSSSESNPTDLIYGESTISKNELFHQLKNLSMSLRHTCNEEKRELLKEQISLLGWNPEVPFTRNGYENFYNRLSLMENSVIEIDVSDDKLLESYLSESRDLLENIPKNLTSEYLKDKIVPVFVCLSQNTKLHSKGIMWFTDSEWSHASIGFDESLDTLYSFTIGIKNAPNKNHTNGFVIESLKTYKDRYPEGKCKVYALFVTPEQKEMMEDTVKWYIDNYENTRYGFKNILNIFFRRITNRSNDKCKMVCSQFVYTILTIANIKMRYTKDSSLISPADLDNLTDDARFYAVYQGEVKRYDPKRVKDLCYRLLPTLPMEMYGIVVDEE